MAFSRASVVVVVVVVEIVFFVDVAVVFSCLNGFECDCGCGRC